MQWMGRGGQSQARLAAARRQARRLTSERATSATAPTPTVAVLALLKRTTPLGSPQRSEDRSQPRPHHAMEAEHGLEGVRVRAEDMGKAVRTCAESSTRHMEH